MKGSIRFNNDIIAEVDVDPSAASGSRLTSCKNLIDGQELGGGGGSSDFSTAQVTVKNIDSGTEEHVSFPALVTITEFTYGDITSDDLIVGQTDIGVLHGETKTGTAVIYDGHCLTYLEHNFTLSGNITQVQDNFYNITGDCTIEFYTE